MESDWILDRYQLWRLHREHPHWGAKKLAHHTPRSLTWVKKWLRRLRGVTIPSSTVTPGRAKPRPNTSVRSSSTAFWPFAISHPTIWDAFQDPRLSFTTSIRMRTSRRKSCTCPAPRALSGRFCASTAAFSVPHDRSTNRKNAQTPCSSGALTSKR